VNVGDINAETLVPGDGSFYHDDEFFVIYTYSFLFMQQRPDIKVVVEPQFAPSFVKLTAHQNSSSTGYFLFAVANSTGTSKIARIELQSLSMIDDGTDLFWPITSTISLHMTSFTLSIAFTSSINPSNSALSLMIASALRSIVCSPIDLPT